MTVRISVAMCTYNGALYLRAQLHSLLAQSIRPVELVVCDDGSSDETVAILREFASAAEFPVRIYENHSRLGFADNFLQAARMCRGDWVAFCDQDDVWLPHKLAAAGGAIESVPTVATILQNAFLCGEALDTDGRVFPNSYPAGFHPAMSKYGFWVWPGFLQTVRAEYFHRVPDTVVRPRSYYPGHPSMTHDKWTCMMANASGGAIVLAEPVALYRRHETALTGSYEKPDNRRRVLKALAVGNHHYHFLSEVASETAEYLRQVSKYYDRVDRGRLEQAADKFDRIAQIQEERAKVYSGSRTWSRVKSVGRIVGLGGYWGPAMTAMGWKSAGKDVLAAVGLLAHLNQSSC